ncbi:MAG TPA: TIGR02206 family membrane protein [Rhizomicrobium sp.]|jgi:hypothetical integral membrane protein (TIGR02206 family)|nr:TIGR02206 family membrane protein [Rhizomicrobium sp.]
MHDKFVLFGTQHLIVMALTLIVPLILAVIVRGTGDARLERFVPLSLAALLIGTWIAWYVLFIERSWITLGNVFPMNLCDWATIAVIFALIRPSIFAFEVAYFWGLAGTMQGLVTPDVNYSFPEPQFVVFMLGHAAIIGSVIYLMAGAKMRPVAASIPRVIGWTLLYAAVAATIDWLLGVNYGFFRAKPGHATVFDFMPAWPYYIPEMIVIGILATLVLYVPWAIADLVGRRPRTAA